MASGAGGWLPPWSHLDALGGRFDLMSMNNPLISTCESRTKPNRFVRHHRQVALRLAEFLSWLLLRLALLEVRKNLTWLEWLRAVAGP